MQQRHESGYYGRHFSGSPGQRRILAMLYVKSPLSQQQLLEVCGIRPASLSELLNKMEASGYIIRTKDENDRRSANVSLTEKGRKQAEAWQNDQEENHDDSFSALTQSEQADFCTLLDKLVSAWESEDIGGYNYRYEERMNRFNGRHHRSHGFMDDQEGPGSV
ncbi:MAG: MarR family transcriptional regulator [Sphaerochaetaceae bacterium]